MPDQSNPNTEGFLPRKKLTKRQITIAVLIAVIVLVLAALVIAMTKL